MKDLWLMMDLSTFLSSALDEPLPWVIAGLTILGPTVGFFIFLWLFRVTRRIITKNIYCPVDNRRATVEFLMRVGEPGPYCDVLSCSLQGKGGVTCQKSCLTPVSVLNAPFIAIRKERVS